MTKKKLHSTYKEGVVTNATRKYEREWQIVERVKREKTPNWLCHGHIGIKVLRHVPNFSNISISRMPHLSSNSLSFYIGPSLLDCQLRDSNAKYLFILNDGTWKQWISSQISFWLNKNIINKNKKIKSGLW